MCVKYNIIFKIVLTTFTTCVSDPPSCNGHHSFICLLTNNKNFAMGGSIIKCLYCYALSI